MSLDFRATLHDPDLTRERPMTRYFRTKEEAEAWAKLVLSTALDGSEVSIYQSVEEMMGVIRKQKKQEISK